MVCHYMRACVHVFYLLRQFWLCQHVACRTSVQVVLEVAHCLHCPTSLLAINAGDCVIHLLTCWPCYVLCPQVLFTPENNIIVGPINVPATGFMSGGQRCAQGAGEG